MATPNPFNPNPLPSSNEPPKQSSPGTNTGGYTGTNGQIYNNQNPFGANPNQSNPSLGLGKSTPVQGTGSTVTHSGGGGGGSPQKANPVVQQSSPQSASQPTPQTEKPVVNTVSSQPTTVTSPFGVTSAPMSVGKTSYVPPPVDQSTQLKIANLMEQGAHGDVVAGITAKVYQGKATTSDYNTLAQRGVSLQDINTISRQNDQNRQQIAQATAANQQRDQLSSALDALNKGSATSSQLDLLSKTYASQQETSGLASIDPNLARVNFANINAQNAATNAPKLTTEKVQNTPSQFGGRAVHLQPKYTPLQQIENIGAALVRGFEYPQTTSLSNYDVTNAPAVGGLARGFYETYGKPAVTAALITASPFSIVSRAITPAAEATIAGGLRQLGLGLETVGASRLAGGVIRGGEAISEKGISSLTANALNKVPLLGTTVRAAENIVQKAYGVSPVLGLGADLARGGVEITAQTAAAKGAGTVYANIRSQSLKNQGINISNKELDNLFYNTFIPAQQQQTGVGGLTLGNFKLTVPGALDNTNFGLGVVATKNAGGVAVVKQLMSQGYTQQQADKIYQEGILPRVQAQTAEEFLFKVNLNQYTEVAGRNAFSNMQIARGLQTGLTQAQVEKNLAKFVVPTLAGLGAVEGTLDYAGQQILRNQKVSPLVSALSGGFGTVTSSVLGAGIAAFSPTRPRLSAGLEFLGNVGDPFEAAGDARATITQVERSALNANQADRLLVRKYSAGGKDLFDIGTPEQFSSQRAGAVTPTPRPRVQVPSLSFSQSVSSQTFVDNPAMIISPTAVTSPTSVVSASISTDTNTPAQIFSATIVPSVTTPAIITTPTNANVNIPSEENVPAQVPVPANANVPTVTAVPVTTFGQAFPLPFLPTSGFGTGNGRSGKSGNLTYYDELAAGFSLFGINPQRQVSPVSKQTTASIKKQQKEFKKLQHMQYPKTKKGKGKVPKDLRIVRSLFGV